MIVFIAVSFLVGAIFGILLMLSLIHIYIRQFLTYFDERSDAFLFGEATEIQRIVHTLKLTKDYPPPLNKTG